MGAKIRIRDDRVGETWPDRFDNGNSTLLVEKVIDRRPSGKA
jgi:hypothetical protein